MKYYLSTRDLVTIAVLASLGGALSTYVGYLGKMVNQALGVPFGAGQFMAGLHVLWIILALGITRKKGSGIVTGTLKGLVELFLGSTHGIVIVVVSLFQGLVADICLFPDKAKESRDPTLYSIAGGLSSAANVLVLQGIYFSNAPLALLAIMAMLACGSGIIFGGILGTQILASLEHAGVVASARPASKRALSRKVVASIAVSAIFLASFTIGAAYYFASAYTPPGEGGVRVEGAIERPYVFEYNDFKSSEITITAELNGTFIHEPARNFTGIPLHAILSKSLPKSSANELVVNAKDGYSATFSLSSALSDTRMIIIKEDGKYRLIASNYDGSYWVRDVCALIVR